MIFEALAKSEFEKKSKFLKKWGGGGEMRFFLFHIYGCKIAKNCFFFA